LGDTYCYLPRNNEKNEDIDKKWLKEKIKKVMDEYKLPVEV